MQHPRIDISQDLEGEPVVFACFDAGEDEVAACAHAVSAIAAERYRTTELSGDDVVQLRELTALADELGETVPGIRTVVLRPARLSMLRDAVAAFVESRDGADWTREQDRDSLALVRAMLFPLEQLCAEALRAALSPGSPHPH